MGVEMYLLSGDSYHTNEHDLKPGGFLIGMRDTRLWYALGRPGSMNDETGDSTGTFAETVYFDDRPPFVAKCSAAITALAKLMVEEDDDFLFGNALRLIQMFSTAIEMAVDPAPCTIKIRWS
jgi:hypothetical protein